MIQYVFTLLALPVSVASVGQSLFPVQQQGKWGYCDSLKQIMIEPTYSSATIFSPWHIATVGQDGLFGFIDTSGKALTPIQYDRWSYFWCPVTYVWKNGRVGIIDSNGREVLPLEFHDVDLRCNGPIALKTAKGWQLYSAAGKRLNRHPFDSLFLSSSLMIGYQQNGLWGIMSKDGKVKTTARFDEFAGFSTNGLGAVRTDDKWGYVDIHGAVRIPMVHDKAGNFQHEGAWVRTGGLWSLVDSTGRVRIPPTYHEVSYFKEGLAYVQLNGKWGYITPSGDVVIPFLYNSAFEFSEGLAHVCPGDSCGYIDRSGHTVVPFVYSVNYGGEFNEGLAEVRSHDARYGFIDRQGKVVVPIAFDTPADYNSFENGIGQLLLPHGSDRTGDRTSRTFYFDRKGTLYLHP